MRMVFGGPLDSYYIYHTTLNIRDEVAEGLVPVGLVGGTGNTFHIIVPVKVGKMPPFVNVTSGCAAVTCNEMFGGSTGATDCTLAVPHSTRYNAAMYYVGNVEEEVQFCKCIDQIFERQGTLLHYQEEWTPRAQSQTISTSSMGLERSLQTEYDLACNPVELSLKTCAPGWVLKGTSCVACEVGKFEVSNAVCMTAESRFYVPLRGQEESGKMSCPLNTLYTEIFEDGDGVIVQLARGASSLEQCTCAPGLFDVSSLQQYLQSSIINGTNTIDGSNTSQSSLFGPIGDINGTTTQCQPCTRGASCLGNVLPPIARPGYSFLSSTSPNVYQCPGFERCPGPECDCVGGRHDASLGTSMLTRCGDGYLDGAPLCSLCSEGYAMSMQQCRECTMGGSVYLILSMALILIWFPAQKYLTSEMESLEISFEFVQFLGIYSSFGVK